MKKIYITFMLFSALLICSCANQSSQQNPEAIDSCEVEVAITEEEPVAAPIIKVDSTKISELKQFFNFKKDEFDPENGTWIQPKSAPKYANRNGIYLYFKKTDNSVSPLRMRIQYYDDDWLFFSNIVFNIDGEAIRYVPINTETDCGDGGMIWEWSDEAITGEDVNLIKKIASGKNVKLKFNGKQYYDTRTMTSKQLSDFKHALELYQAYGGSL